VRAGKDPAIGRLVGAAMKLAGGQADAAELRSMIQTKLRG
jgi:Asp-tRNA(Asn)/Glu-tRNA(Gln) amidotransferase B subunit